MDCCVHLYEHWPLNSNPTRTMIEIKLRRIYGRRSLLDTSKATEQKDRPAADHCEPFSPLKCTHTNKKLGMVREI
jgi:hypothetical protein